MRHCIWSERDRIAMALFDASIELQFGTPLFRLTEAERALSSELDIVAREDRADDAVARKRAANRAWYAKHREECIAKALAWEKANPERRSEIRRNNYLKNRAERLAYQAAYRARKRKEREQV